MENKAYKIYKHEIDEAFANSILEIVSIDFENNGCAYVTFKNSQIEYIRMPINYNVESFLIQ